MFIQNVHGNMVNISELQHIELTYQKGGFLPGHHITGHRTFDRDKIALHDNFKETLGIYGFRMHAETVYEDLMKASANSEPFRMPHPVKIVEQAVADGTIKELQEYEEIWLKENNLTPAQGTGCVFVIGVFIAVIVCSLL